MNLRHQLLALVLASGSLFGASACSTEAYCWDCSELNTLAGGSSGNGGSGGTNGMINISGGTSGSSMVGVGGNAGGANCALEETICDGKDDNCDGVIDDGFDFSRAETCGTCETNCRASLVAVEQDSISCIPPEAALLGKMPGTCDFSQCIPDFWDVDSDKANGCEYYCAWNPDGTNSNDPGGVNGCGKDDDCDGTIDEDVDTCADTDCGRCGHQCTLGNAVAECTKLDASQTTCTEDNTQCTIKACAEGYYDIDTAPENGCEYQCADSGNEVCDGEDNDCDGLIDNQDPSLETEDANVGDNCYGDAQGECAKTAHRGVQKCVSAAIVCCDQASNTTAGTNPTLPSTGLRNGMCDVTSPVANVQASGVLKDDELYEVCDNLDNDCDGATDDSPTLTNPIACGLSEGTCTQGTKQCVSGVEVCVGESAPATELCNGTDDNCDGVADGVVPGTVTVCTSNAGLCASPLVCMPRSVTAGGGSVCAYPPEDVYDGGPIGCNVPPAAPCWNPNTGVGVACNAGGAVALPQGCTAGALLCSGGQKTCAGDTPPASTVDVCGADTNCNGTYEANRNFQDDVNNCGGCGIKCGATGDHTLWTCVAGDCQDNGCQPGFSDCSGGLGCETACTYRGSELCNGLDDDCDCALDAADVSTNVNADPPYLTGKPDLTQACGIPQVVWLTGDDECRAYNAGTNPDGVELTCNAGAWTCQFENGYCSTGQCTSSGDPCDYPTQLDQNCNGTPNELLQQNLRPTDHLGATCFSDDGLPFPGHGSCRQEGVFTCDGPSDTICDVAGLADPAGEEQEICDHEDNDCDGLVDEPLNVNVDGTYVQPAVVDLGSTFMFQYEASRPNATVDSVGSGNGYHDDGVNTIPPGVVASNTYACSVPDRLPWFNVTPAEAVQTCEAIGGRLCDVDEWQAACESGDSCTWGYGQNCDTAATYGAGSYCNLELKVDDNVIATESSSLQMCFAELGTDNDGVATNNIYDMTGNLREITAGADAGDYNLMGGAFNTESAAGAACNFSFYTVGETFSLYDTGFRCCFDTDPR